MSELAIDLLGGLFLAIVIACLLRALFGPRLPITFRGPTEPPHD